MIIPSIDIMGGQAVQLIGGEALAIEAGDPTPLAERFSRVGEIAVIDLDAAMGQGSNREQIAALCRRFPCRVGGGIRDLETARFWLDQGARKIIIGTAAKPELLSQLPKERLMVALDAKDGEVVVEGWKTKTGLDLEAQVRALAPYVGGFLITFVEREGRLGGTAMDRVQPLLDAAGGVPITFAGGVTTPEELAALDRLGADAQVGMALYSGRLGLAEAFAAPLKTDRPDGLWTTVVVDEFGRALGLAYSNLESLTAALELGQGVYWSRRRGLWHKGLTSGATQTLLEVSVDCDRDALRFTVKQSGPGFCHLGTTTCWGSMNGLPELQSTLASRLTGEDQNSYTLRLSREPGLLTAKLREELEEFLEASEGDHLAAEAADLLYFMTVRLTAEGVPFRDVLTHLQRRRLKVSRRKGDAKPRLAKES